MTDELTFAAEFPAASREQWLKLVDGVLKGAPFDKRLIAKTYDGLAIAPLYPRRADAAAVSTRAASWQVMQRLDHPDPAAANAQARHDLANGATGLALVMAGSTGAHGFGLPAAEAALARALDGVDADAGIALDCDLGPASKDAPRQIAALLKQRGVAPETVTLRAGYDPLGAIARLGVSIIPWPDVAPHFAGLVRALADDGFNGPFAVADGRVIHDSGGSEAQELAFALAVAVAYLRALEASGVDLDAARGQIFFRLSADADQFLTMAKFRALRKLWARVEAACGLAPKPAFIAAETAWRMMTRRDPFVNMLRATIAVVGAGLGGADAITVLPHTLPLGLPDRFARRVARNTQLILLEESHLAKVADPAAGSGGIEDLTAQLCNAAWTQFQDIERAGGAWGALQSGLIQNQVAAVRTERQKNIARRRDALTGTSEFPNLSEASVSVLDVAPMPEPAITGTPIPALPARRLAEPFEALRDASDSILAASGARPRVFLANLGTPADFTARATFAKNLFEAGGIEAIGNDGFASSDEMLAAYRASGAKLVCLCASDAIYAARAAPTAQLFANARHIYLAGRPGDHEAMFRAAGIGTFIHAGGDVLATLRAAHDMIIPSGRSSGAAP